jgi:hypothetical protein
MRSAVSNTSLVIYLSIYARNMRTIQTLRRCLHKLRSTERTEKTEICTKPKRNWEKLRETVHKLRATASKQNESADFKTKQRARVGFLLIYSINLVYYAKLLDGSLISNWWLWFALMRYHAFNMRSMTSIGQHLQGLLLTPCVEIA